MRDLIEYRPDFYYAFMRRNRTIFYALAYGAPMSVLYDALDMYCAGRELTGFPHVS